MGRQLQHLWLGQVQGELGCVACKLTLYLLADRQELAVQQGPSSATGIDAGGVDSTVTLSRMTAGTTWSDLASLHG